MKRSSNAALATVLISLGLVGCGSDEDKKAAPPTETDQMDVEHPKGDMPKEEHPTGEEPKSEHPTSEHPK